MKNSKLEIPVYQDCMFLLRFISFTGASTFVPYGDGIRNPETLTVILRVIQQISCLGVFLLMLSMSIFEIVQFFVIILKMKNIGEIIPNLFWLISFTVVTGVQVFYVVQKPILLKFFQRWQEIYNLYSDPNDPLLARRTRPWMYITFMLTVCSTMVLVILLILDFPILSFLPSTYDPLTTTPVFTKDLYLTCLLFGVSIFYILSLSTASDLIPSLIYFHLALALEKTSQFFEEPKNNQEKQDNNYKIIEEQPLNIIETKTDFGATQQNWQKGWLYYESIRRLIQESNSRFGLMLVLNHGGLFFIGNSNVFSILRWYRGMSWFLLLANGMNAFATIFRLTSTIILCSRLHIAGDHLQSKISQFLAQKWFLLQPCERQFLTAFLLRVQDRGTAASPLGLYSIRPSILLTLLSIWITYLIVLLQFSEISTFSEHGNFTGIITGTRFYSE